MNKMKLFLLSLIMYSTYVNAVQYIEFFPKNPTSESFITFIEGMGCSDPYSALHVDLNKKVIKVLDDSIDYLCTPWVEYNSLGYLPVGTYTVELYSYRGVPVFDPRTLFHTTELTVSEPVRKSIHEQPAHGSVQSGIGVIRGWTCDAYEVEIIIDDELVLSIDGKQSRADTQNECNDTNNGYAALFNWNLLDEGSHTMDVKYKDHYIDRGEYIAQDIQFRVVTMGEEYYNGLNKQIDIQGFPAPGESVTVEWSTVDQNFKIIDHRD